MPVYWERGNTAKGHTALDAVNLIGQEFLDFRADVVADALQIAAGLTPVGKTKRTVRGWGAQVGNLSHNGEWRAKGSGMVRAFLRTLTKPGDHIFFGNDWFVSGFWEHGVKAGISSGTSGKMIGKFRGVGQGVSTKKKAPRAYGATPALHMLARGIEAVKGRRA